jgi:glycosyltransferase involved in cell wall biosynthesis
VRVDVILPCLDEAGALPWVLSRMPEGYHPIVVDNGSSDGSPHVAAAHGATVVTERRRGFGAAAHAGLVAASASIVVFCDADATLDPDQFNRVTDPVRAGHADLVLGRRVAVGAVWPLHARVANALLAAQLSRHTGRRLHDLGPMRAAGRLALLGLGLTDRRFGYPLEMVVRASAAGWRIREVDVDYHRRIGKSKVTGTFGGTLRTVRDMRSVLAR